MPLNVLSIAYPFAPVGPFGVGGAEQILFTLDQALVAAGNRSIVVARQGSEPAGELVGVAIEDRGWLDEEHQERGREQCQRAIDRALTLNHIDVIHMHGVDFHEYKLPDGIPVLVTLHLPIAWYPPSAWSSLRQPVQFCCVSRSQRASCPPQLRDCVVVENGVTIPQASLACERDDFALVLGRICPEKNAHRALEAGTSAGLPVLLGGQVYPYPEHEAYFHQKVEPLLGASGGVQHRFLGPLGPEERQHLLSRAKCLLHPTLAPETSSLVAMEALALGTPVIAYPSGALPEIIEQGETGFLVESVGEMAEAIRCVHRISHEACLRSAQRRFDKRHMLQAYFDCYAAMTKGRRAEAVYA